MRDSRPARPIPEATLLASPSPIWLLEIRLAGRVLRYSTRPVEVTHAAHSDTYSFLGGLPAISVDERADILAAGDTPVAPRVSLDIMPDEDIAALAADGHRLDTATATLSWWAPGTDWDEREIILSGRLRGANYGAFGEPLSATIEPEMPTFDSTIIDPTARIGSKTVPSSEGSVLSDSQGAARQIVIGSPGDAVFLELVSLATVSIISPAQNLKIWAVNTADPPEVVSLLLTEGHVARLGQILYYARRRADGGPDQVLTANPVQIERTEDAQGQPITLLRMSGFETAAVRTARRFQASWSAPNRPSRDPAGLPAEKYDVETYSVTFTNSGFTGSEALFSGVVGGVITRIVVEVTTAFDAGSITIGDSGDDDRYLDNADSDLGTVGTYTINAPQDIVFSRDVLLAKFPVPSSPTTGEATVTVTYQPADTRPIETLGELMSWAAARTRSDIDRAAWMSLRNVLHTPVAGVIYDAELTYWDLLRDQLMPLAPITPRWGAGGVRPLLWPWQGLRGKAIRSLEDGVAGVVRLPGVEYSTPSEEMIGACRVRYGYNVQSRDYQREVVHRAQGREQSDIAAVSGTRWDHGGGNVELIDQHFGSRQVDVLESRWIYSEETAGWVARWRVALLGSGYRLLRIEGPSDLGALDLGDVLTYSEARLGLDDAPAVVVGRRLTDVGRVGLEIAISAGTTSQTMSSSTDGGPDRPDSPTQPQ